MTIVSHDKEPTGPTFCGFLPRRKDNATAHGFSIRLVDPLPDGWGPQKDGLGKIWVHVYCLNSNPEKNHQSEMIIHHIKDEYRLNLSMFQWEHKGRSSCSYSQGPKRG